MFRKTLSLGLMFLVSFSVAHAKVVFVKDKVKVSTGIKSWALDIKLKAQKELLSYKSDKDGYTECRRTEEASNVILCGSYLQRDMNALLMRATIYFEGGIANHKAGDLVANTSKELQSHADIIGGHDITSKSLLEFYAKIKQKCAKNKAFCLTQNETDFYKHIIQPLQKTDKSFIIISYSVQSAMLPQQIVSHEFLHAMYFLDPQYQARIKKFWISGMSKLERDKIKKALKGLGYNDHNEPLIQNEFQAYMLMDGAEDSRLATLVPKFEPRMFRFLTSATNKNQIKAKATVKVKA